MPFSQSQFEDISDLFYSNPYYFAAYRALYKRRNNTNFAEEKTVPFLRSVLFAPLLICYLIYTKVFARGKSVRDVENIEWDHIVSISSTSQYRSYTLAEVARSLSEEGEDVIILCTPSAENKSSEWEENNSVINHTDLHKTLSLRQILLSPFESFLNIKSLHSYLDKDSNITLRDWIYAYNLLLLERIKGNSINKLTSSNPSIHTHRPMPYLISSTDRGKVFVYQYGTQPISSGNCWPGLEPNEDRLDFKTSIPFYQPLTYFVWGETWVDHFQRVAHEDSNIISVGSPWYDYLSKKHSHHQSSPDIDVLFISQAHSVSVDLTSEYESFVRTIINKCEFEGWDFAIKLHPREDNHWYENKGMGDYIRSFKDIDSALIRSKVAVTDNSTAFIEASVLGTPVIVADLNNTGLKELGPVNSVKFLNNHCDVEKALETYMISGQAQMSSEGCEIVEVGSSLDNIMSELKDIGADDNSSHSGTQSAL